jgi:hypothetical protein
MTQIEAADRMHGLGPQVVRPCSSHATLLVANKYGAMSVSAAAEAVMMGLTDTFVQQFGVFWITSRLICRWPELWTTTQVSNK